MTKQLMTLANGKVVLVLEGGYDLPSICDASEICIGALLGDDIKPIREEEVCRPPHETAIDAMQTTFKCQGKESFILHMFNVICLTLEITNMVDLTAVCCVLYKLCVLNGFYSC